MTATVYMEECPTRFGQILLFATDAGLCQVTIPGDDADPFRWVERRLPDAAIVPAGGRLDTARDALAAYLEDGTPLPDLPVDFHGTPFQCAVWREVLAIPYGETRSYAEVGRAIGYPNSGRAVGAANAANPVAFIVPCHRVIGADGTIKGYPGGRITRRMLLDLEGVRLPSDLADQPLSPRRPRRTTAP
jgi:methylated-DNA-[protein]-cysteine S-methyltransferase